MQSEIIIVPALFVMIGFVIWVVANASQRRQQLRLMTDFNSRLLDRLGSVKDFAEFLQTEGGAKLLGVLTSERGSTGVRDRILRAIQAGLVFVALGLGFLFLGSRLTFEEHEAFTVFGVIALSLGLGFLLSSGASYWVARTLGVLDATEPRQP